MAINVAYIFLAGIVLRHSKVRFLNEGWTANFATMFLASVFLQLGLLLFDIPIGFFGFNDPVRIAEMKERWWLLPGIALSPLLMSLSCRSAIACFQSKRFKALEIKQLLLSSFLFGAMFVCLLFVVGIKSDSMAAEDEQFILDYWWGFGVFFSFIHLTCSFIIKGILYVKRINS